MNKTGCNKILKDLEHDMKLGEVVLKKIPQIIKSKKSKLEKDLQIDRLIKNASKKRKIKTKKYQPLINKIEKSELTGMMKKRLQRIKKFY